MSEYGRRKMLQCGHWGEAIVGQFFLCTEAKNCNGQPACPKCSSRLVYKFIAENFPPDTLACRMCGRVWHPGV